MRVSWDVTDRLACVAECHALSAVGVVGYMQVRLLGQSPIDAQPFLVHQFLAGLRPLLQDTAVLARVLLLQCRQRMEAAFPLEPCRLLTGFARCFASKGVIPAVLLADAFDQLCLLVPDGTHLLLQSEVAFEPLQCDERDTEEPHHVAVEGDGEQAAEVLLQFGREVVGHQPSASLAHRQLVAWLAYYLSLCRCVGVTKTHRLLLCFFLERHQRHADSELDSVGSDVKMNAYVLGIDGR